MHIIWSAPLPTQISATCLRLHQERERSACTHPYNGPTYFSAKLYPSAIVCRSSAPRVPHHSSPLTKFVASVANELPPLGCLDLPLVRQLDVVPTSEAVLQVPLGLTMPAVQQQKRKRQQQHVQHTATNKCGQTYPHRSLEASFVMHTTTTEGLWRCAIRRGDDGGCRKMFWFHVRAPELRSGGWSMLSNCRQNAHPPFTAQVSDKPTHTHDIRCYA